MVGEPLPHLLIGPRPFERVGVEAVVLRGAGQHLLDELFPTAPGASLQVAIPERPDQQLRLVQPRGVGRREAGTPPAPARRPVRFRVPRRVAGVAILDQEYPLQVPMPTAESPQLPNVVASIL